MGQQSIGFAYQNSPSTLGLYLEIARGDAYPTLDMTTVTGITVQAMLPGAAGVAVPWSFSIVTEETTVDRLVAFHAYAPEDTANSGAVSLVVTLDVGGDPLPPVLFEFSIRGPRLF